MTEHKQVSPRTVTAYRDTFRLLFTFVQNRTGRAASELTIQELDAPVMLEFLDHLESGRSNQARSRNARPIITHLTRPEVDAILAAPDRLTWLGSRDHALLLAMYNTGARSSEMLVATRDQVSFGSTALFQLHGKGRKERTVPLWPQTARVLHHWVSDAGGR